jgi:hypothetical protein
MKVATRAGSRRRNNKKIKPMSELWVIYGYIDR